MLSDYPEKTNNLLVVIKIRYGSRPVAALSRWAMHTRSSFQSLFSKKYYMTFVDYNFEVSRTFV